MNNPEEQKLPPSIEVWTSEFMAAAERSERSSWRSLGRRLSLSRPFLVPLVAVLALGTTGAAMAGIVPRLAGPDLPPYQGEPHAYMNLATGEPIRCPDGKLLTYTPPEGSSDYDDPKCSDGSVPAVYQRQLEDLIRYSQGAEFGSWAGQGPRFAYSLESGPGEAP